MTCIGQLYPVCDLKTEETSNQIITDFTVYDAKHTLYVNKADKTLTLSSTDTGLLKAVGEHFDQELAKGRFQNCFDKFDSD
ncbi:hypothetical protein [Spirosoma flavum]